MKTLAYSYIRFSSEQQSKGKSLERQKEASEAYCLENGLELVQNYSDLGVSGWKGSNKSSENALGRFLDQLKKGKIPSGSFLIVEHLDRLSRQDVPKALKDFMEILENGINIVTLQDKQLYSNERATNDPSSLIISIMLMYKANRESSDKSLRILDAKARRRKEAAAGKRIITRVCPAWLKAKKDLTGFEIIEEKAEVVRKIFNLSLQGHGRIAISRILTDLQVPVISGKAKWTEVYVKIILSNPATYGLYTFEKTGETIEGYFPPVISKELFDQTQLVMKNRSTQGGRRFEASSFKNLFQHLLICKECGSPLHIKSHGKKYKDYVICYNSHQGNGCKASKFLYSDLENHIFQFIEEIDLKSFFTSDTDKASKALKDRINSLELEALKDEKKVKDLEKQLTSDEFSSELLSMIDRTLKNLEANKRRRNDLIDSLKAELNLLKSQESDNLRANLEYLQSNLSSLSQLETYQKRSEINQKLKNIIKSIEVFTYSKDLLEPYKPLPITSQTNEAKAEAKKLSETRKEVQSRLESENFLQINFKSGKSHTIHFYKASEASVGLYKKGKGLEGIFINSERDMSTEEVIELLNSNPNKKIQMT
jgi:DNA invertase Pin-like site-specific DNA recombinase